MVEFVVATPVIVHKRDKGLYVLRRVKCTGLGTRFVEVSRSHQYSSYRPARIFREGYGRVELWREARYACYFQCVLVE